MSEPSLSDNIAIIVLRLVHRKTEQTFKRLKKEALAGIEVSIITPGEWGRRDVVRKLSPGNVWAKNTSLHTTYLGRERHL